MAVDSGLKNLQRSDTKCWGQGRQCGSKNNTLCDKEPAYKSKQDTHKDKKRGRHKRIDIFQKQQLQMTTTTLTKGYKVTLYSD